MDRDHCYMIAIAVRKKANCYGRKVGALIVWENCIVSTGYNGTPEGITNCTDGGCARCRDRHTLEANLGYDVCICVHAEQNALITAARFGNAVEGSVVYSTLRPCIDCTKAALQAKVTAISIFMIGNTPKGNCKSTTRFYKVRFLTGFTRSIW